MDTNDMIIETSTNQISTNEISTNETTTNEAIIENVTPRAQDEQSENNILADEAVNRLEERINAALNEAIAKRLQVFIPKDSKPQGSAFRRALGLEGR